MTTDELSNQFDVQIAIQSQMLPQNIVPFLQFDEYEKSVFLTKAQNDFVQAIYTGKNSAQNQFEVTEEDRRLLNSLVIDNTYYLSQDNEGPLYRYDIDIQNLNDVMYIVYECCRYEDTVKCFKDMDINVLPVTHDEFAKIVKNPFRGVSDKRVLRLDVVKNYYSEQNPRTNIELVSKYPLKEYYHRYVKYPNPIILVDLNGTGLSIHGETDKSESFDVNDIMLHKIVDLAVQYALQSKNIQTTK